MSQEIKVVLYDYRLFPLILLYGNTKPITPEDLIINDVYILAYRNSKEKIQLDHKRFNDTLTRILSQNDDLLKIRSILLIFMMKNIFDTTPIFETLLTEDILNTGRDVVYSDTIFNTNNRYFNDIFFNELSKHTLLILNFVEIIKSFVKKDSLGYEALYPIINKIIIANESSMTPVNSDQLIFMDETDVKDNDRQRIEDTFPIILPFKMKYQKYLNHNATGPIIRISVSRNDVLKSVWLLDDLKKCDFILKANFGEGEIDIGGPRKEFIDLAFTEIMKKETDLFDLRNGYYWFKFHKNMTEELRKKYRSVGYLLGIAVLNKLTIPIHFPRYFYKKLLHRDFYISDLNIFNPEVFNYITWVLQNPVSSDDNLDYTYRDIVDDYEVDLTNFSIVEDPDFEPELLDDSNKDDFASKVAEWVFDICVREPFAAFEEGYRRVNTNSMLYTSFTLDEIDKIISGSPVKDWESLKKNAVYENGYSQDSDVIKWFWRYFDSLSDDKKFEVLKFITGTKSIPVDGLKSVHIKLSRIDNSIFPRAHTCFSRIDLPQYKSYDELVNQCSEAFPNAVFGFG